MARGIKELKAVGVVEFSNTTELWWRLIEKAEWWTGASTTCSTFQMEGVHCYVGWMLKLLKAGFFVIPYT